MGDTRRVGGSAMSDWVAAYYLAAVLNIAGYWSQCEREGIHWADPIIEFIGEMNE